MVKSTVVSHTQTVCHFLQILKQNILFQHFSQNIMLIIHLITGKSIKLEKGTFYWFQTIKAFIGSHAFALLFIIFDVR